MPPNPSADLRHLANGFQVSQAIHVAATLGIADLLKDGPRTSDDLAAATHAHPGSLYRLLRALGAVGVFHEGSDKLFSLTPMGECLRSDAPQRVGYWAAHVGQPYFWQVWGHLLHSVKTGEEAFRHIHGVDLWTYRSQRPEEGAIFDRAMSGQSTGIAEAVISAYDLSAFERVVDVGGGEGTLIAGLLGAHTNMHGVLFDLPTAVARAQPILMAAGVGDRCDVVGGSFFEFIPADADAYLLKSVLHDWDNVASIAILKMCRRACKPTAKLLIVERVIGASDEASTYFMDLNMLVMVGGQERTKEEFSALLSEAGFRLEKIATVNARLSVIEGVPI